MIKKFFKYLTYVIITYILLYASYNIFLLFQVLNFYFVCVFTLFIVMLFWCAIGICNPKKLPFFQGVKNRFLIIIVFTASVYGLLAGVFIIENYFYRRDPIYALKYNASYLSYFFANIHPFDGDSHSFNQEKKIPPPEIFEISPKQENEDIILPPIHDITLQEVQKEFPEKKPRKVGTDVVA